ncbi:MAG: hypothetical protein ABIK89_13880 [Planctomycetota bacterium]
MKPVLEWRKKSSPWAKPRAIRPAKVTVHGHQYSGIPVETCTTCHDRGKRIGVSFQGLMEIPYTSPYTEEGEGLTADWSRLVTEEGRQLQTVGHHFKGSRPLNNEERAHIDRQGVCLACHQEIPDRSPAVSLLHHVAEYTGQLPKTAGQHNSLAHKILLLAAWVQVVVVGAVPLAVLAGALWVWRRRKRRSPLKKQITESPPQ